MSRFLADENIPRSAIEKLRKHGWDIKAVAEECPGASDIDVIRLATSEGRIIVTFGADYGELVYHKNVDAPAGILYLRLKPVSGDEVANVLLSLVSQHADSLTGYFFTIDQKMARKRPIR